MLLVLVISSSASANDIGVELDGSRLSLNEPPIIENGRAMVPLRSIFEALGADVKWDESTQTISTAKDGITTVLTMGSKIAVKNNTTPIELKVPARVINQRILVPFRFVSESCGVNVVWEEAKRVVNITSVSSPTVIDPSAKNYYELQGFQGIIKQITEAAGSILGVVLGSQVKNVRDYKTIAKHENGFYTLFFSAINKCVFMKPGDTIFYSIGTESFTNQPIKLDKSGHIILTDQQIDYIVSNTSNDNAYRVRTGTAIDRVTYQNYISIYADRSLTRHLTNLPVGEDIRVINTLMDGILGVVTAEGSTGFVDARYIRILGETLPPLYGGIDKNKLNPDVILVVGQEEQRLRVYRLANGDQKEYNLEREVLISTGNIAEHTPNGYFFVKPERGTWFYNPRYSAGGKYFVQFMGGYLLHSVACDINGEPLPERVASLGSKVTSGCVGMPIEDARYIYNIAKPGTLLVIDNKNTDIESIASKIYYQRPI